MDRLLIHRESLPTRCEICHQADCFDAARNLCSRCDGVAGPLAKVEVSAPILPPLPDFLRQQVRKSETYQEERRRSLQNGMILAVFYCLTLVLVTGINGLKERSRPMPPVVIGGPNPVPFPAPPPPPFGSPWKPLTELPADLLLDHSGKPVFLTPEQVREQAISVWPGWVTANTSGTVTVAFVIDADGMVPLAWVVDETKDYPEAHSFASDCLMNQASWHFRPLLVQGKPRPVLAMHTFVYRQGWKNRLATRERNPLLSTGDVPPPPPPPPPDQFRY